MSLTRRQFIAQSLVAASCVAGSALAAPPVTIFAAASLKAALDQIVVDAAVPARVSYAGSGTLARQILQGAPAELYISAHPRWMDEVAAADLFAPDSRVDLLGNSLVLITPIGAAPTALDAIPDGEKISMGFLDAVPAGQYGRAAFEHLGLWQRYKSQVVQSDSARAALALVARGELPFGVVYATDALAEPRVAVAAQFPASSHPKIRYPMALIRGHSPAARAIYDHLLSAQAAQVFRQSGFEVL